VQDRRFKIAAAVSVSILTMTVAAWLYSYVDIVDFHTSSDTKTHFFASYAGSLHYWTQRIRSPIRESLVEIPYYAVAACFCVVPCIWGVRRYRARRLRAEIRRGHRGNAKVDIQN
jgi:hypothetical protein